MHLKFYTKQYFILGDEAYKIVSNITPNNAKDALEETDTCEDKCIALLPSDPSMLILAKVYARTGLNRSIVIDKISLDITISSPSYLHKFCLSLQVDEKSSSTPRISNHLKRNLIMSSPKSNTSTMSLDGGHANSQREEWEQNHTLCTKGKDAYKAINGTSASASTTPKKKSNH